MVKSTVMDLKDMLGEVSRTCPLDYRTRAINHRGFYSKIIIWGLRLSHKKANKKCILAYNLRGAATNGERPLVAGLQ